MSAVSIIATSLRSAIAPIKNDIRIDMAEAAKHAHEVTRKKCPVKGTLKSRCPRNKPKNDIEK